MNPFQKVPVIQDGDFALTESVAIMRYLASTREIADHWYPKDVQGQARVDEYLEWQHQGKFISYWNINDDPKSKARF